MYIFGTKLLASYILSDELDCQRGIFPVSSNDDDTKNWKEKTPKKLVLETRLENLLQNCFFLFEKPSSWALLCPNLGGLMSGLIAPPFNEIMLLKK